MTIEDPTAIPETEEAVREYLDAADAAWDREDPEAALPLYHSAAQSRHIGDRLGLATYRLALMHLNRGETDDAYRFAKNSDHPGAGDLLQSIDNATADQAVDPNRIPASFEEAQSYRAQAEAAVISFDYATAVALYGAIVQCTAIPPGSLAGAQIKLALALHHQGNDADARAWAEAALPASVGESLNEARSLLSKLGVHVTDGNPYETEGSKALLAGIEAFERGDTAAAKTSLETSLTAGDSTTEDMGRAAYYLGSIAYHAGDFDTARAHLHRAQADAPAGEREWATQMLQWRWQETTP